MFVWMCVSEEKRFKGRSTHKIGPFSHSQPEHKIKTWKLSSAATGFRWRCREVGARRCQGVSDITWSCFIPYFYLSLHWPISSTARDLKSWDRLWGCCAQSHPTCGSTSLQSGLAAAVSPLTAAHSSHSAALLQGLNTSWMKDSIIKANGCCFSDSI